MLYEFSYIKALYKAEVLLYKGWYVYLIYVLYRSVPMTSTSLISCQICTCQPASSQRFLSLASAFSLMLLPAFNGLKHWHLPWLSPSIVPHPHIDLIQFAAIAPHPAICRGPSQIMPTAVWIGDCWMVASLKEARHQWNPAQDVLDMTYMQAWDGSTAGSVI